MKKYLLEEYQIKDILSTLIEQEQLLTEGKFSDTLVNLVKEYFPIILDMFGDKLPQVLAPIETAFVTAQATSNEVRKWILGMLIKNPEVLIDTSPEELLSLGKSIKRFISNKALVEKNGEAPELIKGGNQDNLELLYVSQTQIDNAIEIPKISLLRKAPFTEIKYEDNEIIVFHILDESPQQRLSHEIISGWCTKRLDTCSNYARNGYLWNILLKSGASTPFSQEQIVNNSVLQFAGSVQAYVKRDLNDNFGTTERGSYGTPVEIRNSQNTEITLKPLFERYNPKLLTVMASGIINYIKKHKMLFWYDYIDNSDVKRQFPEKFLFNIDQANTKALQEAVSKSLGVNGTLEKTQTILKYIFKATTGEEYTLSINAAIQRLMVTRFEFDPKESFIKIIKRRINTTESEVSYKGLVLFDVNHPETYFEYIDLKEMANRQPIFSSMYGKIDPKMFGSAMYKFYKQKYPTSSNSEIFNTYFLPFLNVDELYRQYQTKSDVDKELNVSITIPMFKHELTALLLRPLEDIEKLPTMIELTVDLVPNFN